MPRSKSFLGYVPRYAGVAERAGIASAYARARDVEVVERVAGSSSTDFWGFAHVPSQIEAEVLRPGDLERRLDLLQACWSYFDDLAARMSPNLLVDRVVSDEQGGCHENRLSHARSDGRQP